MTGGLLAEALDSENASAALQRGLMVPPVANSQLIAAAQRAIGYFQQKTILAEGSRLLIEENSLPLVAAARTLQSVATALRKVGSSESDVRSLLMLSACAYAMHGNFPSACAVLNDRAIGPHFTESEAIAISICNPSMAAKFYANLELSQRARDFLQDLIAMLTAGLQPQRGLVEQLEQLMVAPVSIAERVYLRCARLALHQLQLLSVAKFASKRTSPIFRRFIERLIEDGRFAFLPPQYRLLEQTDIFSAEGNALLSLPTSSGKTLLAEFALIDSLQSGPGISIYLVPYIALGNQVVGALRRHCPAEIGIVAAFGGYEGEGPSVAPFARTIVVATPERFDLMLRSSNIIEVLRLVVVDEAHLIENGVRGARLEGIISRLLLRQLYSPKVRLLLVSAVLDDISALADWLKLQGRYYHDGWRPTARRVAVWSQRGELHWLYGNDALRPVDKAGLDAFGMKPLPLPQRMYPPRDYAQMATQKPAYFSNVSFLSRYLSADIGGPILIVCMTKSNTRGIAEALARELAPRGDVSPARDAILSYIANEAPYLRSLGEMVRCGVAFHNSSLPPRLRGLIEEAVRARAINFVASTTTLAEGVDLPFRVSVVADWLIGFREHERPISPLLFRNIAGRCGRAGEFAEGDTVLFDNVLGGLRFTQEGLRQQWLGTLFLDPPSLKSAAFDERVSREEQERSVSAVASQFMASVPEFPNEENLANVFSLALYASHSGQSESAGRLMANVRAQLLDSADGEPLAVAASPIRLTSFGVAANKTGLSPQTCREMRSFLRKPLPKLSFWEFCSHLLLGFGSAPEQQNLFLRQLAQGSKPKRFFVAAADLPRIAEGYYTNVPLPSLFSELEKARKSKSKVSVKQWVEGERSDFVEDQYDKFVDFTEHAFGNFLPWMMRSCSLLSPFGGEWAQTYDWNGTITRLLEMRAVDRTMQDEQLSGSSQQQLL